MRTQNPRRTTQVIPHFDRDARTEPYPRDHGRPKPGDFPYECPCGKGPRHWVHSVKEWQIHRNSEIEINIHAKAIAVQPKRSIPAIYRDHLYPPQSATDNFEPDPEPEEEQDEPIEPQPSTRNGTSAVAGEGGIASLRHLPTRIQKKVVAERVKIIKDVINFDKDKDRDLRKRQEEAQEGNTSNRTRATRKTVSARSKTYDEDFERREEKRLNRIKKLLSGAPATADDDEDAYSTGDDSGDETDPEVQINQRDAIRNATARKQQTTERAGVEGTSGAGVPSQPLNQPQMPNSQTQPNRVPRQPAINPLDPELDEFDYAQASKQRMSHKAFASLSLLQMQQDGGITTEALSKFTNLVRALMASPSDQPTDYRVTRNRLANRTNIHHIRYDVCIRNCFCYAADPEADTCPHCDTPRSPADFRDRVTYDHIPIIPRLRLRYSDAEFAETVMKYRASVMKLYKDTLETKKTKVTTDFWTGQLHAEQLEAGKFDQATDMGFAFFTDGVQIFKSRVSFTVWPLALINLSLPPEVRFLDENIMIIGILPGPKGPDNLNSFLIPLYDELDALEMGVEKVYNGFTKSYFTLRAYICLICADQKGREKVMGTSGVPSYAYCPYCWAHGFPGPQTTYCPPLAPINDAKGKSPLNATNNVNLV